MSTTINTFGEVLEIGTRVNWDPETESLFYVDVTRSHFYQYNTTTNNLTRTKIGVEPLAFGFPTTKPNEFIAGVGRKIILFAWDGKSPHIEDWDVICEVDTEPHLSSNRLNGGKVDPFGRLWAGTMGPNDANGETVPSQGSLYSLTGRVIRKHETNIGISNGLAWNVKERKMYYVDTLFPGIYQYDYNPENGNISNRKVIFQFKTDKHDIQGKPDGLTIDSNGLLWVTVIFGSAILNVDPNTGKIIQTLFMPTSQITSVCWGDTDLQTLYVTTAQIPEAGIIPPHPAGCTFKLTGLKSKGLPETRYVP